MAEIQPIRIETNNLRTGGLRPTDVAGQFVLQSFGVEKSISFSLCSTLDLKGTGDMQAVKPGPVVEPPTNGNGPYKSVSYQSRNIITEISGDNNLEFSGTEQLSSYWCDSDNTLDPEDCDESILI